MALPPVSQSGLVAAVRATHLTTAEGALQAVHPLELPGRLATAKQSELVAAVRATHLTTVEDFRALQAAYPLDLPERYRAMAQTHQAQALQAALRDGLVEVVHQQARRQSLVEVGDAGRGPAPERVVVEHLDRLAPQAAHQTNWHLEGYAAA